MFDRFTWVAVVAVAASLSVSVQRHINIEATFRHGCILIVLLFVFIFPEPWESMARSFGRSVTDRAEGATSGMIRFAVGLLLLTLIVVHHAYR